MLGFEVSPVVQYVIAFAIIAILLALFAIVLKRIGGKRFAMGSERGRGRQPRLGIVDVYDLDRQRQLVLLRRDNVEHLVMLGGPNDCVIESNIVRMPQGRAMAPVPAEVPSERAPEQAIPGQPAYQPGVPHGLPPQAAAAMAAASAAAATQPAPQPQQGAAPISGTEMPAPQTATPATEPDQGQEPVGVQPHPHPATEAKPEPRRGLFGFGQPRETQAAEKPAPQFPPRPRTTPVAPDNPPPYPPRRTAPNLPDAPSDSAGGAPHALAGAGIAAAGLAGTGPDSAPAQSGAPSVPAEPDPASPKPGPAAAPAGREDALLSDMARELEAAFKRPASGSPDDIPGARPAPAVDVPVAASRDTGRDTVPAPEASATTIPEPPSFPARNAPPVADAPHQPNEEAFSLEQAFAEAKPGRQGGNESLPSETSASESLPAETAPDTASSEAMPVVDTPDEHSRATSPHAPAPGMTPAPASGPAHFATAIEESPQPQAAPRPDVQTDTETPAAGDAEADEAVTSPVFALAQEMIAEEALDGAEARPGDDVAAPAQSAAEAMPRPETGPDNDVPDARTEPGTTQAIADNGITSAAPIPAEAAGHAVYPDESNAEDAVREDSAVSDQPQAEPASEAEQPARTVDPFSVDEIEAEFARLLGRSTDKDSKSS